MAWPPSVSDFKDRFFREFIFGDGLDTITDRDITRALAEAGDGSLFSQSNFDTLPQQTTAFLYLAAHFIWKNVNQAGGLSAVPRGRGVRAAAEGITNSKGVGQVNVQYQAPPDWIAQSPTLSALWASPYGRDYLTMLGPRLRGNMAVVGGPDDITPAGLANIDPTVAQQ